MTDFPQYRNVVSVCPCAGGGEAVYCDDGAIFYLLPNDTKPRVPIEGTPVPGSKRASERGEIETKMQVAEWEQVARNLAQVLANTAAWVEEFNAHRAKVGDEYIESLAIDAKQLRSAFAEQCVTHGISL